MHTHTYKCVNIYIHTHVHTHTSTSAARGGGWDLLPRYPSNGSNNVLDGPPGDPTTLQFCGPIYP